jgi:MFS family permease
VRRWRVILILAAGQFIMVLDGTVMNVSISQLVSDLGTSVASIQLAITAYTLVMASFMLTGGKMGDLLGRRRAFVVGLGIYGTGSFITAISPNIGVLLVGWSLIEGLGAVLVVPAILSLTAGSYRGRERSIAYGVLGGVAAAGVAVGPLIGGWVTSNFTWRYVFAAESVLVVLLIVASRAIPDVAREESRPRLDVVGMVLSALGLGLMVLGILASSSWGWVRPRRPPTIGDMALTPFGFSPTGLVILAGVATLTAFLRWEASRVALGRPVLMHPEQLRIPTLRAGLTTLLMQQLVLAGTFFVLPLYLQVVLGFDAFESGVAILPLSAAMLIAALGAARFATTIAPRRLIRAGLGVIAVAEVLLLAVVDPELRSIPFGLSLALLGTGVGLLASQLGNVILSSVDESMSSEAGGLQGTAQNLGASLGTALIGAILLTGLTAGFRSEVIEQTALPGEVRELILERSADGLEFVPAESVERAAMDAGLPPAQVTSVVESYSGAQLEALRSALAAAAIFVLLGFLVTRDLPARPMVGSSKDDADEPTPV